MNPFNGPPVPTRRQFGACIAVAVGLTLVGCGGGDDDDDDDLPLYRAFNALEGGMTLDRVRLLARGAQESGAVSGVVRWTTDTERLDVSFSGASIASARWTNLQTGLSYVRTFRGGASPAGTPRTLYEAFLSLRPGMTRAEVIRRVPVRVSQGAATSQVLWVQGQEALGVRFAGSADSSVISFAQWGLSIPAGSRDETRTF